MNHLLICTILGFVLLGMSQISEARWFGPNTYEDCILESMKGVTSDRAAKAIEEACRNKFPIKRAKRKPSPKTPKSYPLPFEALRNIKGGANWSRSSSGTGTFSTDFEGTIYNNTAKWVITEITVKIKPKSAYHPSWGRDDEVEKLTHVCRTTVGDDVCLDLQEIMGNMDPEVNFSCDIKPKSEGVFRCPQVYTPKGKFEHSWHIMGAKGYQLK